MRRGHCLQIRPVACLIVEDSWVEASFRSGQRSFRDRGIIRNSVDSLWTEGYWLLEESWWVIGSVDNDTRAIK